MVAPSGLARILVIDDDPKLLSLMKRGLAYAHFAVDVAPDGEAALALARERAPDLVVLDLMLPGLDGLEVCRRLRAADPRLPILMLTAKGRVPDRIAGLDAGADDYVVKPFDFDELLARIRALMRRANASGGEVLRFADLTLDSESREVWRGSRRLELTAREFELLEFFMRRPRRVLSREQIYEGVWGSDYLRDANLISVHIMRLREKLEARGEPRLLHTLRGAGYSLREA